MATPVFEEQYVVIFSPTPPADPAAPTATEVNTTTTNITALMTKDGFNPNTSENMVDTGTLDTAFDSQVPGSWGSSLALRFKKDDTTDTAWDLFPRGTAGAIYIAPYGLSGVGGIAAVGDKLYVWPDVQAQQPQLPPSAPNEQQSFTVTFAVGSPPEYYAEVAA